jgi:flavorubredoxin
MKFDIVAPGVKVQYVPESDSLEACFEYGRQIGKAVMDRG